MSGLGPSDNNPTADTGGPALLAVSVTTTIVALSTCVLRYCFRTRVSCKLGWDDNVFGLALLFGLVGVILTVAESVDREQPLQFDYIAQMWLNMSSTLSKVSVCLFVMRLVSRARVWRIVLGVQIVLLLVVNLAYSLTTLLQCRPLEKLWTTSIPGQCWGIEAQQDIGYFQGAFDVFSQLFIALFPVVIIQDLGMSRNVCWPFYTLSMTSVAIIMLVILRTYDISLIQSTDEYMSHVVATIFAVLEQNFGILAANILPIASFWFKDIRPTSQALGEAADARDSDTASILSHRSRASKASRRQSHGSSFRIEGPERASYDAKSIREPEGIESWPMGIIKTVSVDVVEEDAADLERGVDISNNKRMSGQRRWDSYLR